MVVVNGRLWGCTARVGGWFSVGLSPNRLKGDSNFPDG